MNDSPSQDIPRPLLIKEGLDHAWNWFSLHASQRLQGVNFFLVALAFLSGAYVSALHFELNAIAAGVAALALIFSVAFYMLESRIRELLKAGEAALKPAQKKLAELTGITQFRISEAVEKPRFRVTAYSKVFRALFLSTIITSALGTGYAIHLAAPHLPRLDEDQMSLFVIYRSIIVVAGVCALYLSKKVVSIKKEDMGLVHYLVASGLLATGTAILILSILRPIK